MNCREMMYQAEMFGVTKFLLLKKDDHCTDIFTSRMTVAKFWSFAVSWPCKVRQSKSSKTAGGICSSRVRDGAAICLASRLHWIASSHA